MDYVHRISIDVHPWDSFHKRLKFFVSAGRYKQVTTDGTSFTSRKGIKCFTEHCVPLTTGKKRCTRNLNFYDSKKSACNSQVFVVTEVVFNRNKCDLNTTTIKYSAMYLLRYLRTRSEFQQSPGKRCSCFEILKFEEEI